MGRRLGWLGLVVALATGAAVRWTLPGDVEDLKPRPDALEYEEAARNLASGQGYSLVLDGGHYPPRYPPGFSLLLVPAMWLTGGEHGAGVWMVLASALAGIACLWAIGLRVGGAASGTAAALLLALAPLHVRWSRAVMSDVPATTVTTALALGGLAALGRGPGAWFALGLAAGLAALLRSTCTLLALPLAGMLVADPGARAGAGRRLAALTAGVGVGLLPLAAYDVVRFGSPLADGYHYWVGVEFFAWPNVVGVPTGGTDPNLVFYARQLAGGGALYSWPIAILAAAGCVLGVRRPGPARALVVLAAGTALVLLAVYLPFFWQWDRFLLPLVPLVLALAAIPLGTVSPGWLRVAAGGLIACALSLAVFTRGAFAPPDRPPDLEVAGLRAIAARVEPNAVLIARSNVMLVARLYHDATERLWLPVDRCEHRALIRERRLTPYAPASAAQNWVWDVIGSPLDPEAVEAAVHALLASGRPVYFSPMLAFQTPAGLPLNRLLQAHFRLDRVETAVPTGLLRVRERS
jgi:4-amino-4-deoxy-L-arabinose transferase-like glycosyltransferase